jgi:hypothetical protein
VAPDLIYYSTWERIRAVPKDRSIPFLLFIYFSIIGTLALGAAFGITKISGDTAQSAKRERTLLNDRIANAREIKRALARPLPKPDPLPPISAKLANPNPGRLSPSVKSAPKVSPEALNAMAMDYRGAPQFYSAYDRHKSGGW